MIVTMMIVTTLQDDRKRSQSLQMHWEGADEGDTDRSKDHHNQEEDHDDHDHDRDDDDHDDVIQMTKHCMQQ